MKQKRAVRPVFKRKKNPGDKICSSLDGYLTLTQSEISMFRFFGKGEKMFKATKKIQLIHTVGRTLNELLKELPKDATPTKIIIHHNCLYDLKSEVEIIGYRLPVYFTNTDGEDSKPGDVFLVYTETNQEKLPSEPE